MKTLLILALSLTPLLATDLEFAREGDAELRKRLAKIEGAPAIPIELTNWINSDALKLSDEEYQAIVDIMNSEKMVFIDLLDVPQAEYNKTKP